MTSKCERLAPSIGRIVEQHYAQLALVGEGIYSPAEFDYRRNDGTLVHIEIDKYSSNNPTDFDNGNARRSAIAACRRRIKFEIGMPTETLADILFEKLQTKLPRRDSIALREDGVVKIAFGPYCIIGLRQGSKSDVLDCARYIDEALNEVLREC